jgi:hypothetical protein
MGTSARPFSRGILATGLGLAWLIGMAWLAGGGGVSAQTAPSNRPLMSDEAFKNVQVLKGIPVDDFMGTMGVMCAALAFDCSDCHDAAGTDRVDWAADTPRKRTARRMVTMMQGINRDNFNGRQVVTCWTCHRNRDRPLVTPTMEVMYGEPVVQRDDVVEQAPGLPATAAQIFDKYIAALGGTERLSRLTSYAATGTSIGFGGFGGGGEVRIYAKAPDKRSTIIQFKDTPERGDSTRTYNGTAGWVKTPLTVLGEYALGGSELDGARLDALLGFPGQIKSVFANARVGFPASVEDRPVQVVQAEGPGGLMTTMYFDSETGLLVRLIRYGKSPIGRVPTQVDISDYREVAGVKMPFKWTFAWLDGRDSFQLSNVQPNVPVDEVRFGRPDTAIR